MSSRGQILTQRREWGQFVPTESGSIKSNDKFYKLRRCDGKQNTENLAQVIADGKNFSQRDAVVVNPGVITGSVVDYYIATIPLHILCDLFAKMPLVKGAYLKITLNLNANCSTTINSK